MQRERQKKQKADEKRKRRLERKAGLLNATPASEDSENPLEDQSDETTDGESVETTSGGESVVSGD